MIHLFYIIFLVKSIFYTIRLAICSYHVTYTFRVTQALHKPKLFRIIANSRSQNSWSYNHSLSKRIDISFPQLLKLSHVLVVLQLVWVQTSPQFSPITRCNLAPFSAFQGSCGINSNGPPVGSFPSVYVKALSVMQSGHQF